MKITQNSFKIHILVNHRFRESHATSWARGGRKCSEKLRICDVPSRNGDIKSLLYCPAPPFFKKQKRWENRIAFFTLWYYSFRHIHTHISDWINERDLFIFFIRGIETWILFVYTLIWNRWAHLRVFCPVNSDWTCGLFIFCSSSSVIRFDEYILCAMWTCSVDARIPLCEHKNDFTIHNKIQLCVMCLCVRDSNHRKYA